MDDAAADLIGRIGLLFNMVPLILETDSSRVISIMIQDHGAVPKVQGVSGSHHNISHHGQDEAKIAQLKKIESQIVGKFDGRGLRGNTGCAGALAGCSRGSSDPREKTRREAATIMQRRGTVSETIGAWIDRSRGRRLMASAFLN